jgi:hypothetical protein
MKECGEWTVRPIVHCQKLDTKTITLYTINTVRYEEDLIFHLSPNYTRTVVFELPISALLKNVAFYSRTYTVTSPPQRLYRGAHKEKLTDNLDALLGPLAVVALLTLYDFFSFSSCTPLIICHSFPQLTLLWPPWRALGQFIQILYVHTSISKIPNISNISLPQNITATALFCVFN